MKAIIHAKYGSSDELQLQEVEKPIPKDNEILVKIFATTVTTSDCNVRNFTFVPKLFKPMSRIMFGFRKPKKKILGIEYAGEVESVGKNVNLFKIGDKVLGTPEIALGSHAEYISVPENSAVAVKPDSMTWEEATTLPLAGGTALYFIKDLGKIKSGQSVLINGASGAIGTFSVQLAKYYGASVTAICSSANFEMVKSLGADSVIDYTKDDFTQNGNKYDVIFDVAGKLSYSKCKNSLNKEGLYLVNLIEWPELIQMIWTSLRKGKKAKGGMATTRCEDLVFLLELYETGKMKTIIDRRYPLKQIAQAYAYVETGHKKGNVVISIC
jgi:NADPH:quinone reductase-like Zn-dependent oxidoreductase